jgi:hemerythrin
MPLIAWNDEMSVGVRILDEDHKCLVELINELHDGIMNGCSQEVLGPILNRLVGYTEVHFDREEKYFGHTGYPDEASHKLEHHNLTARVRVLRDQHRQVDPVALSLETIAFLKSWLITHIEGCDKKYGPYLNSKGIS